MGSFEILFILAAVFSPPVLYVMAVNAIFKKTDEEISARKKELNKYYTRLHYSRDSPEFKKLLEEVEKDKWKGRIYFFFLFLSIPILFIMINVVRG